MSKRSKKGFKRLQDHELAEFTSLRNGGPGDSGSESELLDLTTIDEHDSPACCSSCCYWFMCLYLGLLTCLLLIMGVFGGYLAVNMWLMQQNSTDVHSSLEQRIVTAETNLDSFKKEVHHQFLTLHVSLSSLNFSLTKFYEESSQKHNSTFDVLRDLEEKLNGLDERLKVIEATPKETLLTEVGTTQKEMVILSQKLQMLNQSLEDLNNLKIGVAQLDSQLSHQNDRLTDVGRQLGDMTKSNTDAQNDVANMADKIDHFKSELSDAKTSIATSQEQIKQTSDLLSAKVTHLQTVVVELNDSLIDEVDSLWTNWTQTNTNLLHVTQEVSLLKDNVTQLETKTAHIHTSIKSEATPPTPETPTEPPNNQQLSTTHPSALPSNASSSSEVGTEESPSEKPATKGAKESTESNVTDDMTTRSPSGEPVTSVTHSTESQSTGATEDQPLVNSDGSTAVNASVTGENSTSVGDGGEDGEGQENQDLTYAEKAAVVLQDLLDNFSNLDSDSNDKLTLKEFKKFLPPENPAAQGIFTALDSNSDLLVSRDEIESNLQELKEKEKNLKEKLSEESVVAVTDVVATEGESDEEEFLTDDDDLESKEQELKDYMENHRSG